MFDEKLPEQDEQQCCPDTVALIQYDVNIYRFQSDTQRVLLYCNNATYNDKVTATIKVYVC